MQLPVLYVQQDLVVYPSSTQQFASADPKLRLHPSPNPLPLGNHKSDLCVCESVFLLQIQNHDSVPVSTPSPCNLIFLRQGVQWASPAGGLQPWGLGLRTRGEPLGTQPVPHPVTVQVLQGEQFVRVQRRIPSPALGQGPLPGAGVEDAAQHLQLSASGDGGNRPSDGEPWMTNGRAEPLIHGIQTPRPPRASRFLMCEVIHFLFSFEASLSQSFCFLQLKAPPISFHG